MTQLQVARDVTGEYVPVNAVAMLNELKSVLDENGTNNLESLSGNAETVARALLWVLNSQMHGQIGTIDMMEEYRDIRNRIESDA